MSIMKVGINWDKDIYLKNAAIFMTSEMQNGRSRLSKEVIFTLLAYDTGHNK